MVGMARRIGVERLLLRWRGVAVVLAVGDLLLGDGAVLAASVAAVAVLVVAELAAAQGLRSPQPWLARLALPITLADAAAASLVAFNHANGVDSAVYLVWLLVVLEAATRWALAGGVVGGVDGAAMVLVWASVRRGHYHLTGQEPGSVVLRMAAMVLVGTVVGAAIRRDAERSRSLDDQVRRMEALHRFALEAPRLDVVRAAERIAGLVLELGYERVCVLLADQDSRQLEILAMGGYSRPPPGGYRPVPFGQGITGRCARTGQAQLVASVADDPDYVEFEPGIRSELAVPLAIGTRTLGVIDVASTRPGRFTADDTRFLGALAGQLAQALENARLGASERDTIEELRKLNVLKDDFIAIASHELRTPLTSLRGFVKTMLMRDLSPEQAHEFLRGIERQADRLTQLVEDLLAVNRIEGGRAEPVLERVDLAGLVDETVREVGATGVSHNIVAEVEAGIEVRADRSFLRRVLVNLLTNAVRYSPADTSVRVVAAVDREASTVTVAVSDQGAGLTPDDQARLFEKFTRFGTGARQPGGTGLGLFIVKGLVEAMGGHVEVRSQVGQGSTFSFSIPLVDVGAVA
jgi:signal transduction histidine kinase